MKGLTIWQPWATLLALGVKKYETRSWQTQYRGPAAIHASVKQLEVIRQGMDAELWEQFRALSPVNLEDLPLGCIIAKAELVDCHRIDAAFRQSLSEPEIYLGDFTPGRYAWEFKNMAPVVPVPARGHMHLWELPADVERQLKSAKK